MSRVHGVEAETIWRGIMTEAHGALVAIIGNTQLTPRQKFDELHKLQRKTHESLTIVERALAQPPSIGSPSTISPFLQPLSEE